jgi:hypothetical protein
MANSRFVLLTAIALIAIGSGCNGGITNPQQNAGTLSVDFPDQTELLVESGTTYSISGDGSSYIVTATSNVPGVNDGDEVTLTVPIEALVPYTVTAPQDGIAQVTYYDYETNAQYYGQLGEGGCSITITQTSPTLVGSFNALVVCPSIPDTIALRNGLFNASPQ